MAQDCALMFGPKTIKNAKKQANPLQSSARLDHRSSRTVVPDERKLPLDPALAPAVRCSLRGLKPLIHRSLT